MFRLPEISGGPISISVQPHLTAHRGKLLSGSGFGTPVHAASFIRKRSIVLETGLLRNRQALRLIVVHEIFHFVWVRLGNAARQDFTNLLVKERRSRARGELGESAAAKKSLPAWRDYVCESFCDTAAWMYAGVENHVEFTLSARWRNQRKAWFECTFEESRHC